MQYFNKIVGGGESGAVRGSQFYHLPLNFHTKRSESSITGKIFISSLFF